MQVILGLCLGFIAWFIARYVLTCLYTVDQNQRAVKTSFGRAKRIPNATTLDDPIAEYLSPEEKERYKYPHMRIIPPGGPYFKWPWERVYKVDVATQTVNMAFDPESPKANQVSIITSTAERQAAVEFAKAEAIRPEIVGEALRKICQDPETATALFTVLEYQRLAESQGVLTLVPEGNAMLASFLAAQGTTSPETPLRGEKRDAPAPSSLTKKAPPPLPHAPDLPTFGGRQES